MITLKFCAVIETTFRLILINQMDFIFQQWIHKLSTEPAKKFPFHLFYLICAVVHTYIYTYIQYITYDIMHLCKCQCVVCFNIDLRYIHKLSILFDVMRIVVHSHSIIFLAMRDMLHSEICHEQVDLLILQVLSEEKKMLHNVEAM